MRNENDQITAESAADEKRGIRGPPGDARIRERRASGDVPWENDHPINLRLSIPLLFGGCYLTIVAGKERRRAIRRAQDRLEHPIRDCVFTEMAQHQDTGENQRRGIGNPLTRDV